MSDAPYTNAELVTIFEGEIQSRQDFIDLHKQKRDRPESWFHEQYRRLKAFIEVYRKLVQAVERDRKKDEAA